MKRGRTPKPDDRRQNRNPRTIVALVPTAEAPPAPKGLLKPTRAWWDVFWSSDVSGAAKPENIPALERLAFYYDEHLRLRRALAKDGRFAKGYSGQLVMHPAAKQILSMENVIARLEGELGLTPMARTRLIGEGARSQKSIDELNLSLDDDPSALVDKPDDDDPRVIDVAGT